MHKNSISKAYICQKQLVPTHVKTSSASPSSSALTRNLTATAPLFPIQSGPHPVQEVCTSVILRPIPSSLAYTSKATPTLTLRATSVYSPPLCAWTSLRISWFRESTTWRDWPVNARWRGKSSWKPTATMSGGSTVEAVRRVGVSQSTKSCGRPALP